MLHNPGIFIATLGGVHLPVRASRMECHIPSSGESSKGYTEKIRVTNSLRESYPS